MASSSLRIILIFSIFVLSQCNIVLKPNKASDFEVGLILVQGASIEAKNYKLYAKELQEKFNGSLWVGLTEFPLNVPEPVLINETMNSMFRELKSAGFKYDSNTPFFFVAHSLGGIILQNYLFNLSNNLLFKFSGLILEGSFILRSNLAKAANPNFPPVLTLGAELDGLARITRIAESYYHNNNNQAKSKNQVSSLTLVIPGINHYQFVSEGNPPSFVVKNDIKSDVNNSYAIDCVTSVTNVFINLVTNRVTPTDLNILVEYQNKTIGLLQPLLDAFDLEGFYHFVPPCSSEPNLKPPKCTLGSKWSIYAQELMGLIDPANLAVNNDFINIFSIPERFPSINNNCTTGEPCVLNVTALTANSYSTFDGLDTGLYPIAAEEAKTKMNSRQSILQKYTNQPYDFNQTDATDLCGEINQEAINWALKSSPRNTVLRYLSRGVKLFAGPDIGPVNNGALWLSTSLSFQNAIDPATNKTIVQVRSPTLRTPTDYNIKFVAGFHYCKLLTPARAIEWIYVDSLKP